MTRNSLIILAAAGSAAALLGALVSQYVFGLAPCALCIWQRWPHLAAVVFGALGLVVPGVLIPILGALSALTTGGVGMFHFGVEQKWWEGLQSCSGGAGITGLSMQDLLDPTKAVGAVVRCDDIAASFAGVSMAGWNVIVSLGLAVIWLAAARRRS